MLDFPLLARSVKPTQPIGSRHDACDLGTWAVPIWTSRTALSVKIANALNYGVVEVDPTGRLQRGASNDDCHPMTTFPNAAAIARFLEDTPEFFVEHAELLSKIRLSSALGGRTLSLQERQMDVLRQKVKSMELRLAELTRVAQENHAIAEKFQLWTRALLLARNDVDLPHFLIAGLKEIFLVPQATLRLWRLEPGFSHTWFAAPVSEDAQLFANGLHSPFCGRNDDFEAATWLEDSAAVASVAMLPLRSASASGVFGLLVLGSPDPQRFTSDMATDFLENIAESSSAALSCLLA